MLAERHHRVGIFDFDCRFWIEKTNADAPAFPLPIENRTSQIKNESYARPVTLRNPALI